MTVDREEQPEPGIKKKAPPIFTSGFAVIVVLVLVALFFLAFSRTEQHAAKEDSSRGMTSTDTKRPTAGELLPPLTGGAGGSTSLGGGSSLGGSGTHGVTHGGSHGGSHY